MTEASAILRIGNSFDGSKPANGSISGVRVGNRMLSEYSYSTLSSEDFGIDGKDITVDEVKRFFDRSDAHKPEMTTGAVMFAPMTDAAEYEHDYYTRSSEEIMVTDVPENNVRNYGAAGIKNETIGMQFRLYQLDNANSKAYFDNAMFQVSNILWEFSPDGGEGHWYQLYDLPNRARTRMTLPEPTTTIRARALSNSPDEWIQSFAITPIPDMQGK